MRRTRESGSALIIALVTIILMLGVVAVLATASLGEVSSVGAMDRSSKAGYYAESGIHIAIAEINASRDLSGDGKIGWVAHGSEDESVAVSIVNPALFAFADGTYPSTVTLLVVARSGLSHGNFVPARSTERRYTVVLKTLPPFPAPGTAALSLLGDPTDAAKKAKIDIKKGNAVNGPIGDGHDQANGPVNLPGLGIQMDAFKKLDLKKGYNPDDFLGAVNGVEVTGWQPITAPPIDFDAMDAAAKAMDAYATALISNPSSTKVTDLGDGTKATPTNYTFGYDAFGTPIAGSVTVIDTSGGDERHWDNANITGQGTLIITGSLDIHHNATLNWKGDVFVLGNDKGKDSLKIDHDSQVKIDGGLYMLGVDNKEAKLRVHGDSGKDHADSALTVNGPVIVIADKSSKSKAEFKAHEHDSMVTINGYLGLFGDKIKLDAKSGKNDLTHFQVNGEVVLAVPGGDKDKIDVKLNQNVDFDYDSVQRQGALDRIAQFFADKPNVKRTYTIGAWYEAALK